MAQITFQGNPINTSGELPQVGDKAPDFILVDSQLNDISLSNFKNMYKVLNIVPSLDTPVCQKSTKVFNEKINSIQDAVVLTISADLPFAMERFCSSESLTLIKSLSMMRSRNFAKDYGVLITDGPLKGITARAIVVIDKDDNIIHTELVNEIANEPNYENAMKCIS
ncbi:MAG: lipid hydroperoxide peroxidase [Gammaproteobacteria bacterium]|nr:lipid hydroperoxide peroxidase [Gammaproteobacteria bacterium]|tara:strand:- start:5992 stop:6492 length:501 start_codon:yes stop_codon:yes gene_type:complete